MPVNYLEYKYDDESTEQRYADIQEAKEIAERAEKIRSIKGDGIARHVLMKDKVSEEEIEAVLGNYTANGNEYLVDGAILRCDKATLKPVEMEIDDSIITCQGGHSERTKLHVTENGQNINGLYMATVGDAVQGKNIFPFECNCSLLPDRQWEEKKIKENIQYCKEHGTCSQLMNLNEVWDNFPSETPYFTYSDVNGNVSEKKEGINMMSLLFCRHGGLIMPITSGQIYLNLMEIFGEFNLNQYIAEGNATAIKLKKIGFTQEKMNILVEATKEIYESYYIIIDPVFFLGILVQEGNGSFNTSSTNRAADGQHGFEKDFAVDSKKAVELVFEKCLGFTLYGNEFLDVVNNNKTLLNVEKGNMAQYVNWGTPKLDLSDQSIWSGVYAGGAQWHVGVKQYYEHIRGEGSMEIYSNYLLGIDRQVIEKIMQDNNIAPKNINFSCVQNGQDGGGNSNGTYTVIGQ